MTQKNLFVHSVDMVHFGSGESVLTSIQYIDGGGKSIGGEELAQARDQNVINEDFKIDLGRIRPGQAPTTRAQFECGDGQLRSAHNIASDFFSQLNALTFAELSERGFSRAKCVLVSEPLQYVAEGNEDWIENYRGNIRRILGSDYDQIQFLPEPFAVYQYYRYGVRHSFVADTRKHCALVIDFGGGTFDVSIVETTGSGDISKGGRHSRPLGAKSTPTGGFEVNRQLAKHLIRRQYEPVLDKERLKKGMINYDRWRDGELELEKLSAANRRFVRWYGVFLRQVERAKIRLSNSISNWSLSASLSQAETISVPTDPFSESVDDVPLRVTASELREVFESEIWKRRLKNCVSATLKISRQELDGRPIDLVLLSGGSSNLRWLEQLVKEEFAETLGGAAVACLRESYQEVVAKGLAIECARRAYEPNSEFSDVVYNPLYLVLDPDEKGLESPKYRPIKGDISISQKDSTGMLIGASDYLDIQDECELTWKARIGHPPRRFLDYFFTKLGTDQESVENRYNYVETKIHTPRKTSFSESSIRVSLNIREDGTCTPTFIYSTNKEDQPTSSVKGTPFVIDLVSADQRINREAFVGIDFGTASSAVSYIDWAKIEEIEKRSNDNLWLGINELVDLPVPIASPLKSFIGSHRVEEKASLALETIEALLCFLSFICWAEATSSSERPIRVFTKNWKRSAGPLKKMLFDLMSSKADGPFIRILRREVDEEFQTEIGELINSLDREKHNKSAAGGTDARRYIERLGNVCRMAIEGWSFGYFENVKAQGFGRPCTGTFRVAHGTPPFHQTMSYEGPNSFSENEACLINHERGEVIEMTPVMFWRRDSSSSTWLDCLLYDGRSRDGFTEYKLASSHDSYRVDDTEFDVLKESVDGLFDHKTKAKRYPDCHFEQESE